LNTLEIKNLGPIEEAKIGFADLTLFVGLQASGKSITVKRLNLLVLVYARGI
jgi:predicted ATPase